MSSGGGGGGQNTSNTVTQTQQIPEFEQQFALENQDLARSLASQPYPVYNAPLVSGFTPTQQSGQQMAIGAANSYQPGLDAANGVTNSALSYNPLAYGQPTIDAGTDWMKHFGANGVLMSNAAYANAQKALSSGAPAIEGGLATIGSAYNSGMPMIQQGGQMISQAGANAQPWLDQSYNTLSGALAQGQPAINAGLGMIGNAVYNQDPGNAGVLAHYMSPYVSQALAPQVQALNEQLGQQQKQTNAQAASANAFGDARQGVQNSLNNFYGNQSLSGLLGQGYNTAYTNALQTALGEQQLGLSGGQALANTGLGQTSAAINAGNALGNIGLGEWGAGIQGGQALGNLGIGGINAGTQAGNAMAGVGFNNINAALNQAQTMGGLGQNQIGQGIQGLQALGSLGLGQTSAGLQEQGLGIQGAQQLANLAGLQQQLGLQGANAVYAVGQQQQQLDQQALNTAYQQYQNQVQWPYQMENIRLSALSNSPYGITSQTTLPQANMTASNLGTFASLAGLLGGSLNGGGQAPFGGTSFPNGRAG